MVLDILARFSIYNNFQNNTGQNISLNATMKVLIIVSIAFNESGFVSRSDLIYNYFYNRNFGRIKKLRNKVKHHQNK